MAEFSDLCGCRKKPVTYTMKSGERVCYDCFYTIIGERFGYLTDEVPAEERAEEDDNEFAIEDARDEGRLDPQLATDGPRWPEF